MHRPNFISSIENRTRTTHLAKDSSGEGRSHPWKPKVPSWVKGTFPTKMQPPKGKVTPASAQIWIWGEMARNWCLQVHSRLDVSKQWSSKCSRFGRLPPRIHTFLDSVVIFRSHCRKPINVWHLIVLQLHFTEVNHSINIMTLSKTNDTPHLPH